MVTGEGLAFTASQIHHLKLAQNYVVWVLDIYLFYRKGEHSVRTTALVIHAVRRHNLVLDSKVVEGHYVLRGPAFKGVEILHCEVVLLVPS